MFHKYRDVRRILKSVVQFSSVLFEVQRQDFQVGIRCLLVGPWKASPPPVECLEMRVSVAINYRT